MNEEHKEDVVHESNDVQESIDDVSFEEVNEEGEVDTKTTIAKLRERIKTLEKEKQEYLLMSQRTKADYINFKKEVEDTKAKDRKYATKKFIEELIPVLDAYDSARNNKDAWEKVDQNWRIGIEYIFGQIMAVLEREGVTAYGKVGDVFDPLLHETLESVAVTDTAQNDTLVKVLQSGYKMHDMVLRPARVHVGHCE
jgi:molecular chaperone GrpE